jgi:hypothetical protein
MGVVLMCVAQESPQPVLAAVGALTSTCEAHDSPLFKLAASTSAAGSSSLLRGNQQQQRLGGRAAAGKGR